MQAKDEITPREMMRRGLRLDGLGQPVDLNAVDWHVKQRNPSAAPSEVQNETLEVIRSLVNDGLVRLGAQVMLGEHLGGVATEGERFVAWDQPLERSMHKISRVYLKHYDDLRDGCMPRGCSSRTKGNSWRDHSNRKTSIRTESLNSVFFTSAAVPPMSTRYRLSAIWSNLLD